MSLIERLRKALVLEYDVESELAGGGMGIVFLARDRRLDRRVAIKVLRPEHATAIAVERFLREGRNHARLSDPTHPNIVPVFHAGEADGLSYLVMGFIEGETLAARLERGPLSPDEGVRLAGDLLAALGLAHSQNIIHRDVKPANIFLRKGQALLGDFGIAKASDPGLTAPGQQFFTPMYMSPEQLEGSPVTPSTDVYAAGLVLYEACTGKRWPAFQSPELGEWRGVPAVLTTPVRRALRLAPEERWPDGRAFGNAAIEEQTKLDQAVNEAMTVAASKRSLFRRVLVAGTVLIVSIAAWRLLHSPAPSRPPPGSTATYFIAPFAVLSGNASLGDSAASAVREALTGFIDFFVLPPGAAPDSIAVRVSGTAAATGPHLRLQLTARDPRQPAGRLITNSAVGNLQDLRVLADSLAVGLVRTLYADASAGDQLLPSGAIPESQQGFALWLKAEQYFANDNWDAAEQAYMQAEAADSTCYLCAFRLLDIDRWLDHHHAGELAKVERALDRFPPHYQRLIRAANTPLPGRLDTLRMAAEAYPNFFLASFEYGDELFHRGPLYTMSRSTARPQFERAVNRWPHFGPGWEHLAWLDLSEGDSASVGMALERLKDRKTTSGFSASLLVLLSLGQAWKFYPPDYARAFSRQVLADPRIAADKDAVAGARLLMTTDAPVGAVEFGRLLTTVAWPARSDAVRGGLLGQLFGFAALGRLDSMRAVGLRLEQRTTDRALPLLASELEAVLRLFDPDSSLRSDTGITRALTPFAEDPTPSIRYRAAWMLGLVAARSGNAAGAVEAQRRLAGKPGTRRLLQILDATIEGIHRNPARGLAALPPMPILDSMPESNEDPLEDAVVRLSRAEWQEAQGDKTGALATLLWHEHLQVIGHLATDPQPGELGWAVGTLARWRRSRLFAPAEWGTARCGDLRAVQRRWSHGQAPFAARADSVAQLVRRKCP